MLTLLMFDIYNILNLSNPLRKLYKIVANPTYLFTFH